MKCSNSAFAELRVRIGPHRPSVGDELYGRRDCAKGAQSSGKRMMLNAAQRRVSLTAHSSLSSRFLLDSFN